MPFFRESMRIGEQDRQDILQFNVNNGGSAAMTYFKRIFDDAANLISGAVQVPEVMRMGLITRGTCSFLSAADRGVHASYQYNYDPDGKWEAKNNITLLGQDAWSDRTNSNPLDDIHNLEA